MNCRQPCFPLKSCRVRHDNHPALCRSDGFPTVAGGLATVHREWGVPLCRCERQPCPRIPWRIRSHLSPGAGLGIAHHLVARRGPSRARVSRKRSSPDSGSIQLAGNSTAVAGRFAPSRCGCPPQQLRSARSYSRSSTRTPSGNPETGRNRWIRGPTMATDGDPAARSSPGSGCMGGLEAARFGRSHRHSSDGHDGDLEPIGPHFGATTANRRLPVAEADHPRWMLAPERRGQHERVAGSQSGTRWLCDAVVVLACSGRRGRDPPAGQRAVRQLGTRQSSQEKPCSIGTQPLPPEGCKVGFSKVRT